MRGVSIRRSTDPDYKQLECCYFVYLCSGEIVEVGPATDLQMGSLILEIFRDGSSIARFPRADVYFCSTTLIAPPVLW